MSTNTGVTPSSYDLVILVSRNIKRFLERTKMLVYENIWANFHTEHITNAFSTDSRFYTLAEIGHRE